MTLKLQQDKTERRIDDSIVKIVHRASLFTNVAEITVKDVWIAADTVTWEATRTAVVGEDS